ncbi:chromosome segregation protein SMC [Defluviimonas sp. WL0002]|uniref:Chromosome segregation protein SMC n=1 Tax=Albidovulum marisflavi TaxID=2984159 RepID=A0ABT2ZH67_9RHOB|nr:chromosome segregation protein SMC [Defluviimonas sp. WL0002]MCV2870385.1 chromosome segregation protein SMC [Defluviimonas sp. WL0002]
MRLRTIDITNVRRFAGKRASLSGIGDGITVLSEPNEFGKSTFFDALHALFFEKHRSHKAPVKALQPHAGGAPEVAVEVELPDGRFRISKRWLQRPQARVTDANGRLIAQEDEAEAWIDRLMGGDLAGPSGLLWVRQGLHGMEPEGAGTDDRRERERGLAARRDLLSSVAGEIDMMTGGRRMDAVLDRVAQDYERLATATGRPKAGGEWARALEEAETLASEEANLRPRAVRLSADLERRAEVKRSLARLTDPHDAAARADGLRAAEAAHLAAQAHNARVEQAEAAARVATLDAKAAQREIDRLQALVDRLEQARGILAEAEEQAKTARARAEDMASRDRSAAEVVETAAAATRELRLRLARAMKADAARSAQARAEDLRRRLDRATSLQGAIDSDRARRQRIIVTAKALDIAEKAQNALDFARARAESQAVTVEAMPDSGAEATIDGRLLPTGPQPILVATEIALSGFGHLRVDPGESRDIDLGAEVDKALKAIEAVLAGCGVETVAQARQSWSEALRLDAALAQGAALLAEVAPDGVDALRGAIASALAEVTEAPAEVEDPVSLTAELAKAEQAEDEARASAKAAHAVAIAAGEARAGGEADRRTAERRLTEAQEEAGEPEKLAEEIAFIRKRLPELHNTGSLAAQALEALKSSAPDLATCEAGLARARSAVEQARQAESAGREELARLNATISALADEGIEERLAGIAGARAEAEARAARYEAEVRALNRLRLALEDARAKARDAYFGPVLRELQPLLSILYPGAQLSIDDQSLLPVTLTRDGQTEAMEILSGGTQEQVAILTRLAFARLFAADGRAVPVILDDALVHSDDDRIEAMFTALHRTARDQQILVLTCRQRAFAALGGTRAEVLVEAA